MHTLLTGRVADNVGTTKVRRFVVARQLPDNAAQATSGATHKCDVTSSVTNDSLKGAE